MGAGVRNLTANLTDRIAVPMKISALFGARLASLGSMIFRNLTSEN